MAFRSSGVDPGRRWGDVCRGAGGGARRLLYTVRSDFFEVAALHSECWRAHCPCDGRR